MPYIQHQCVYNPRLVVDFFNILTTSSHKDTMNMDSFSWHTLPNEMQLAIVDLLGEEDVKSLSQVDQRTYQACVPTLFKVRASHVANRASPDRPPPSLESKIGQLRRYRGLPRACTSQLLQPHRRT